MGDNEERQIHVVVAVLGDVGRSPRMQYHALSLLEAGHIVSLVGYAGEELVPPLQQFAGNRLQVIRFDIPAPKLLRKLLPLYYIWRIASLTCYIAWALVATLRKQPIPDCLLLQNPPAIPLLFLAHVFCRIVGVLYGKRPGLVIDWHNLGFSMLNAGPIQTVAKAYEKFMAPLADGHLTVTKAMKSYLQTDMNIAGHSNIQVLYDCPPNMFRVLSVREQHQILQKLDSTFCKACPRSWYDSKDSNSQSLFTEECGEGNHRPRHDRPALIVSSTSWTPDEDFGILLDALVTLDKRIVESASSLKCFVIVTGKGPQKAAYEQKISKLMLQQVVIQTVWLEPGEYPKLIACADVGVSLHTSTSGLDLPMKVLDLFGCQVPAFAMNFACLSELVQDNVNGRVFECSDELAQLFWEQLLPLTENSSSKPHSFGSLDRYSKNLQGRQSWSENWTANAMPVLLKACPTYRQAVEAYASS